MIIASDITTLEQRGKYNGFIGAMVGLGNGIGPLIGGALTQRASWRWCFWFDVPVIVAVMAIIAIVIPPSPVKGKAWTKVKMVDWLGLVVNLAAVVLVLVSTIPVCCGSCLTYKIDSHLTRRLDICMGQRPGDRHAHHRRSTDHSLCNRRMEIRKIAPDA